MIVLYLTTNHAGSERSMIHGTNNAPAQLASFKFPQLLDISGGLRISKAQTGAGFRGIAQPDYGGAPTRPNQEGVFVQHNSIPGSVVIVIGCVRRLANLRLEMSQIIEASRHDIAGSNFSRRILGDPIASQLTSRWQNVTTLIPGDVLRT